MALILFVSALFVLCIAGATATPIAATIEIPIDHFNPSDKRVYSNRYWMNDTYYEAGGPVFMYDNGEAGVVDAQVEEDLGEDGVIFAPVELARKYHGIALIWEHRFYGSSLPFEVNQTTGLAVAGYDAYKYLNNEQALQDVVYFATHFSPPGYREEECASMRANAAPWVWVGGSYAGIRAAMIRQRNPNIFFASWASSAPVQTVVDGSVYYNEVQQNMPANCSATVHTAITYADQILTSGTEAEVASVKEALFSTYVANPKQNTTFPGLNGPDDLTYWEIASILSYPFQGSFLTFQTFGYALALGAFCNNVEAGAAATPGPENAFYAYLNATVQKGKADYQFLPGNPRAAVDTASWIWQLCSQFGQWQVTQAYSSPSTNLISKFYNVSSTEANYCHILFPYAPPVPDIAAILKYGGWRMRPSNIMWTNGAIDPFRAFGVQAISEINPHALNRPSTTVVPACNVPPPGDDVFGLVYAGAVHGQDLARPVAGPEPGSGSGIPFDEGLALFESALDVWLVCFHS